MKPSMTYDELVEFEACQIYNDNIANDGSSPSVDSIIKWLVELDCAPRPCQSRFYQ